MWRLSPHLFVINCKRMCVNQDALRDSVYVYKPKSEPASILKVDNSNYFHQNSFSKRQSKIAFEFIALRLYKRYGKVTVTQRRV